MLTESDLVCKIAEFRSRETLSETDCVKLAAFLTIRDFLYPASQEYSFSTGENPSTVMYDSESEFFSIANGMELERVWKVVDELVETLKVINPRLYAGVIRKLQE